MDTTTLRELAVAAAAAQDQACPRGIRVGEHWVPAQYFIDLVDEIDATLTTGDTALARELARQLPAFWGWPAVVTAIEARTGPIFPPRTSVRDESAPVQAREAVIREELSAGRLTRADLTAFIQEWSGPLLALDSTTILQQWWLTAAQQVAREMA